MKKIMKTLSLLFAVGAMAFGSGLHHEDTKVARAAENVFATLTFPNGNKAGVQNYTTTWTATIGTHSWSIVNANNNNNGWSYIRMGAKQKSGSASIANSTIFDAYITKIVVTVDKATYVTSSNLEYSTSSTFANSSKVDVSLKAGTITILPNSETFGTGNFYKLNINYNNTSKNNGCIQISKVEYYADDSLGGDTGPTDEEKITAVEDAIDAIGTVEYSDSCKKLIDAARSAYNALNEGLKNEVANYAKLTAAEARYEELKVEAEEAADKAAADAVITLLENLPEANEITDYSSVSEVKAARDAYDALNRKDLVPEQLVDKLEEVEAKLEQYAPAIETATITFNSKDKRTEYSTSKQVWEENGIIVTNNKGNSTNDVGDYANPARFYKSSNLLIEFEKAFFKVEFNCVSGYVLTSEPVSSGTLSVSGTVGTLELAESVTEISITEFKNQVRFTSITIHYEDTSSGEETPIYPTDFELSASEITLEVGDESSLKVKFIDENVNVKNVSWSTANSDIIDLNEETGEFKALKEGTATITVSVQTGEQTYLPKTCTIKVTKAAIINFSAESKISGNKFSSNGVDFYIVDNDSIRNTDSQGRGAQFGTSNSPAGTVKFITRFAKFAKEGFKLIINAAMGSGGDATLKVYLGNVQLKDTTEKDTINLTTTATDYEFKADENTPESGYLTIEMNATEKAMYLKSIKVYGEMSANDDAFCKLVNDITTADTCTDYTDAADLMDIYNGLSDDDKTIFSYLTCKDQDYNEDKELVDVTVSLKDKLTYMEYLAGLEKQSEGLSNNLLSNITSSNNILIILVVGLLGLTSILGYYFLNKKKYAK